MFKFYNKIGNQWIEISELELHAKLYNYVTQTTPIIRRLLKEKEVTMGTETFKIIVRREAI